MSILKMESYVKTISLTTLFYICMDLITIHYTLTVSNFLNVSIIHDSYLFIPFSSFILFSENYNVWGLV